MRDIDEKPYSPDERRVAEFFFAEAGIGGGDDPIGAILASHAYLAEERNRFRAGLQIIKEAGGIHGGAWCAAQARGYLEDLDFDFYPETGRPMTAQPDEHTQVSRDPNPPVAESGWQELLNAAIDYADYHSDYDDLHLTGIASGAITDPCHTDKTARLILCCRTGDEVMPTGYHDSDYRTAQQILGNAWPTIQLQLATAIAEEREACAKIALAIDSGRGNEKEIAKAIRARARQPEGGGA